MVTALQLVSSSDNSSNPADFANVFDHPGKPTWYKYVGVSLALSSALFIGSSFVLKKRGLLDSNALSGTRPGDGFAYLKNALWWIGMILMLFGELCNFAAYAFSPAILVTPLGALSVVITAVMSSFFLNEKLNFSGKIGCAQCMFGAVLIVFHAPASTATDTIGSFTNYVVNAVFLVYASIMLLILLALIFYAAPKYGERHPLTYILICSITGSFSVVSTQGFGSAVVYSVANPNDNQFVHWQTYLVIIFVLASGILQIVYLNKALNLFSTAIVTPVYYVIFTFSTLVTSAVLFREFTFSSASSFLTAIIGFCVIVSGVALLFQYSLKLSKRMASLSDPTQPPRSPPLHVSHLSSHSHSHHSLARAGGYEAAAVPGSLSTDTLRSGHLLVEKDGD
ncbi:hypothetical protein HK102_010495, partial [Quaeritorhiza haematococci]